MPLTFSDKILRLKDEIDRRLIKLELPELPVTLYQPMHYCLNAKAKRLRPIMVLLVGENLGA
ncbi:MAG: hypothetical protein V1681_08825, partial [Candidatus Neomarinimicrobiota bacterium]